MAKVRVESLVAAAGVVVGVVAILALSAALIAFPLKWCWNASVPGVFGLPEIGALQAFCLYFVAGCFFKQSKSETKK